MRLRSIRAARCAFAASLLACLFCQPVAAVELERVRTDEGIAFILVSGEFTPRENFDERLHRALGEGPVKFVTFESGGGNPYTAMRLGRAIRRLGLTTFQIKALECSSACTLAFLGGTERLAQMGALGVHRSTFSGDADLGAADAASAIQQLTADIIEYLVEMGVDPALMKFALAYDASDMRYLSGREMEELRVTTGSGMDSGTEDDVRPVPPPQRAEPSAPPAASTEPALGVVRHPRGGIWLHAGPDRKTPKLLSVANGRMIEILGNASAWYRVRSGGELGYVHESWIMIPGYASAGDDLRYVQIYSFPDLGAARAMIGRLAFPAEAYLARNGWIAVTLAGKFPLENAAKILARGKALGSYPRDSFITYGNPYVRKLCCD